MLCIQTQEAIPKHKSTQKVNLCLIESDTEAGNYIYRGLYQFQVIMITNKIDLVICIQPILQIVAIYR